MYLRKRIHIIITLLTIFQLVLSFIIPAQGAAAMAATGSQAALSGVPFVPPATLNPSPEDTTLEVVILSSPWATVDSNDPQGINGPVPKVFMVEARVTNSGAAAATNVILTLDYNPDPVNNWVILEGEDPERVIDSLAPGEEFYAYWFATYALAPDMAHLYTVSAVADNAPLVSTSDNFYGNPQPGYTVKTRPALSTGNSGITQISPVVTVGVIFTATVTYDLGSNPFNITFSPAGNDDFNVAAYRLFHTSVRFFDDGGTWESITQDRLYFPTIDSRAQNARVSYVFVALLTGPTSICPYGSVGYSSTRKYDTHYCDGARGTIIPLDATITLTLDKQVSSTTIELGQVLTYTIAYHNTGSQLLYYVWVWDDYDPSLGTVITGTVSPAPDPLETALGRVAWYLNQIPPDGSPGSSGVLTFSFLVDGNGQDIPDQTALVNTAHFGVNPGSLPANPSASDTVTTTILAPTITASKTDGLTTAIPGELLSYSLQVNNTGSVAAHGVVITDVLPSQVSRVGIPTPAPDVQNGQTLVWNSLGPIPPVGSVTITIPVMVNEHAPYGTVLTNNMAVRYANPGGHVFAVLPASDTTSLIAPLLTVSKAGSSDAVLAGEPFTYTISYANIGDGTATNAVITDTLPQYTTYASCSGAACSLNNGVVTWQLGSLAQGANGIVAFTVLVNIDPPPGAVLTNADYGVFSDQTYFLPGSAVSTVIVRNPARISGVAYVDANANGSFDGGESTLPGVQVTLPQANVPVVNTDANGEYRFDVESQQPVTVSAGLPAGYFRTTPGTVFIESVLGITQTVNFGYASTSSPFGVVFGVVFEDADQDGAQALGESGIPGVTVASPQAVNSPRTTNTWGQYTLRFNASQPVSINETNLAGYISTTPDSVNTNAVLGSSDGSPVNFGDFLGIRVSGQVFNDANVNGSKDAGETGLAGAVVTAGGQNVTTAADGQYVLWLSLPDSSPIDIVESDPTGYVSTNALPGSGMVRVDASTLRIEAPLPGTSYTAGDFGDATFSGVVTVTGEVWEDNGAGVGGIGGDGLRNGSEPALADVLVSLSSGLSQLTSLDGTFSLYGPASTPLTLVETNPAQYVSTGAVAGTFATVTDADHILVNAPGGATSSGNAFGDALGAAGLVLTKQAEDVDGPPLLVFDVIRYTLGITNTGVYTAFQVVVTDDLPDGMTFVDAQATRGTPVGPDPVVWSIPALEPGAAATLWITATINADQAGQSIINVGSAEGANLINPVPDTPGVCPDGSSPVGGVCPVTPQASSDISLAKIASASLVDAGDPLTYTVAVENFGPSAATGVVVTDSLPSSVTLLAHDASQGAFDPGSGIWGVGSLAANANAVLTLWVQVNPDVSGLIENTVNGTSDNYDPAAGNNSAAAQTQVNGPPDLSISKSDAPDPVAAGGVLTYTLTFANNGASAADGLTITDTLPSAVTFESLVSQPPYLSGPVQNGQQLTWTAASLPAGSLGEIVFTVLVRPETTGVIWNSADITSLSYEPTPADNHAEESTNVGVADLATLYGWVFDDLNGNGQKDAGEPGIPGVTITLDRSISKVSGADGIYWFIVSTGGVHRLSETDPAGYFSTTPNRVSVNVSLGSVYRVDFGDTHSIAGFGSIFGTVFNDLNGDGVWDDQEPGIPGVTITLDGAASATTDAYGSYTFRIDSAGMYSVVETDPDGYQSSTPNEVFVDVLLGQGYEVDYGDYVTGSLMNRYFLPVMHKLYTTGR